MRKAFAGLLVAIFIFSSITVSLAASGYGVRIDKTVYSPGTTMAVEITATSNDWFSVEILKGSNILMSLPAMGSAATNGVVIEILLPANWRNGTDYVLRVGRGSDIASVGFEISTNTTGAVYALSIDKTTVMSGDMLILTGTSNIANAVIQYSINASGGGFIPKTGDVIVENNQFECFVPIDSTYVVGTYIVKVGNNNVFSNECTFSLANRPKVAPLVATPQTSTVSSGTNVTLSTATSNTTIYYTLNGTVPTRSSTLYTVRGITINSTTTLKAIAVRTGYDDSDILTQTYTVGAAGPDGGGGIGGGGGGSAPTNPSGSFSGEDTYRQGSGAAISYTIQKDFTQFSDVKVGNTALVQDRDYKAENGSTKITLLAEYLNTLSAGTYTLTVNFKDNTAATVNFMVAAAQNPFTDVAENAWYNDAVKYVFEKGLMIGTAADEFSPESTLTRAMIVTILYRNAGEVDVSKLDNPFNDVEEGQWYADAVKWGAENGIVEGYGNGLFGTHDAVTKEQLAAIIYRTQQAAGKQPPDILTDYEYPDWNQISDWAKNSVKALAMQGLFRDIPGSDFRPQASVARAEVASILYRYLTAIEA